MKITKLQASSLLISLVLIAGILSAIFLAKDNWLHQENSSNYYHKRYLSEKLDLTDKLNNLDEKCQQEFNGNIKDNVKGINIEIKNLKFYFICERKKFFLQESSKKYISIKNIKDWINIDVAEVYTISSLAELPPSSETKPKIVIAKNDINERLDNYFYGVIITDYLFYFTGNKKIYGRVYSSYDNEREERNLTYRASVIQNLERKYATWKYLPHSRNILGNDQTN